jgi:hypothetical protein
MMHREVRLSLFLGGVALAPLLRLLLISRLVLSVLIGDLGLDRIIDIGFWTLND